MSWHCSQALVEAFSEASYLDSEQCARLRSIRTAERSCFDGKKKGSYRRSLSGMTYEPSTASRGVERWISSLRGFRVSHSQPAVTARSSRKTYMMTSFVLSRKSARGTYSSRMSTGRLFRSLTVISPREYPPPPWVPRIDEADGGYLPTPTTRLNQQSESMMKWPAYRRLDALSGGKRLHSSFWEWMMGMPIGWTALEPLETDRFRKWQEWHGKY